MEGISGQWDKHCLSPGQDSGSPPGVVSFNGSTGNPSDIIVYEIAANAAFLTVLNLFSKGFHILYLETHLFLECSVPVNRK